METLKSRINYAFRFYDETGKLIDKLDGPGNIGIWLGGPYSPFCAAILPAPYKEVIQERNLELVTRTIRIPLDDSGNLIESKSEEIAFYEAEDLNDAIELAKDIEIEYLYWIEWDAARVITVVDIADPVESDLNEFYYITND